MKRALMSIAACLAVVTAVAACGSDSTGVNQSLVGFYAATQFTTTGTAGQTNQLLAGSYVHINLNADGTTAGQLHLAPSGSNPAFDADMAGTWRQKGMTVDISQNADTFVKDMTFTMVANGPDMWDLVGDSVFSGTRVQITLSQLIPVD